MKMNRIRNALVNLSGNDTVRETAVWAIIFSFALASIGQVWAINEVGHWDRMAKIAYVGGFYGAIAAVGLSIQIRRWLR